VSSICYPTVSMDTYSATDVVTMVNRLQLLSSTRPEDIAYTFLVGREGEECNITYRELDLAASSLATYLKNNYNHKKSMAILVYEPGLDFIKSFFACLYAGWVAIPVSLPRRKNMEEKFNLIVRDSGASLVMSTESLVSRLADETNGNEEEATITWLATDKLDLETIDEALSWNIQPDSLALLQYTSGSTSNPKGVMISHRNIFENQTMIKSSFEHDENSIIVGWLPHYHDMGLIGNILQPLFAGCRCILMSPMLILQHPVRWLQTISKYKATTSGGPNFAFDLCAREIKKKDLAGLDLSSWDLAFCGAERIHPNTLKQFSKKFKSIGFKERSYYPCYGLAEATLIVTGGEKRQNPIMRHFDKDQLEKNQAKQIKWIKRNVIYLAGCGQALLNGEILIVDPETLNPTAEQEVGEIWISGGNVAQGYWNRAEETKETFNAFTNGKGPYFRSGDLGFIQDGELFVTGRRKELIIIRGQNIYPHDVEQITTNCHPELRPNCCIAFSATHDSEEHLVIFVESKSRRMKNVDEAKEKIQKTIVDEYGVRASLIEILDPLGLPRTSSGKLQRVLCRQRYLDSLSPEK